MSETCIVSTSYTTSVSQHPSQWCSHHISNACLVAGGETGDEDMSEEEKVRQVEEAHLAESMERLIMEAYKLLQQGDMQQAESLLQEGVHPQVAKPVWPHPCNLMTAISVADVRQHLTHASLGGCVGGNQASGGGGGGGLAMQ